MKARHRGNGWVEMTIGDLGKVVTGRTPPASQPEMFGTKYPFITPSDMEYRLRTVTAERYISEAGATTLASIMLPPKTPCMVCIGATIGKVCLTRGTSFSNQQINSVIVDSARHDPEFIYYRLIALSEKVANLAAGAATPIVNKSSFSNIVVNVPPLQVQRRIASILSAYDDLIENNTRRITILEEMTRRLYEEWFVYFRFPGHEQARFKETELGRTPEAWNLHSLYDVAEVTYGHPFKAKDFNDCGKGLGAIRIRDIRDGTIRTFTTEHGKPKHLVEDGDILVGMDGQFHMGKWAGGASMARSTCSKV